MKERPILFNGEMVRATLDDRKTQTRRVVKFPRHTYTPTADWVASVNPDGKDGWIAWGPHGTTDEDSRKAYPNGGGFKCPYGVPGDLLWVRESHYRWTGCGDPPRRNFSQDRCYNDHPELLGMMRHAQIVTVPSIHMPRWASRITLRVVDVRVERVQEITHNDAMAEGVDDVDMQPYGYPATSYAVANFRRLWDSINAARGFGWNANPLVWVVSFEKVTP